MIKNPFKGCLSLSQKVLMIIAGLVLLKTMIVPNPLDIVILVGLVLVIAGWFDLY